MSQNRSQKGANVSFAPFHVPGSSKFRQVLQARSQRQSPSDSRYREGFTVVHQAPILLLIKSISAQIRHYGLLFLEHCHEFVHQGALLHNRLESGPMNRFDIVRGYSFHRVNLVSKTVDIGGSKVLGACQPRSIHLTSEL